MTDKESFIKYKMKKLVGEENYDKKQAFAISLAMFEKQNKAQQGVQYNYERTGNTAITPLQAQQINQNTGIQFTPEFANSYFSTDVQPTPPPVQKDYSKLPIQDITSDGQWTNRKVWRTQKPEWFVGKQTPIEGKDYTTIPYRQWEAYQSSPEYMQYMKPQQQQGVASMQQGGFKSPYGQLPSDVGYDFNYPQLTTPYEYQNPNYQNPTANINNNGFQYNPSAIPSGMPSDVLNQEVNPLNAQPNSGSQQQTQYNDITRYNVPQLYGGVDLSASLAYAGQGFGSGNAYQAALGTSLSALKGARNFLTGYSSGKESDRIKKKQYDDLYRSKINYSFLQQGGEIGRVGYKELLNKKIIGYSFDKNTNTYEVEYE